MPQILLHLTLAVILVSTGPPFVFVECLCGFVYISHEYGSKMILKEISKYLIADEIAAPSKVQTKVHLQWKLIVQ